MTDSAQAARQSNSNTLRLAAPLPAPALLLDSQWHMAPVPSANYAGTQPADPAYDDSAWRPIRLPCLHRATTDSDTVWYRHHFHLEQPISPGARLLIRFGGAFYFTSVWLNGHYLGDHEGYFQPFGFDITEAMQPGDNLLAVRCRFPIEAGAFKSKTAIAGIFADWDCRPYPSTLYPSLPPSYEWMVPAGLWQPVSLHTVGPVVVETFNIFPELEGVSWPQTPDQSGAERARLQISLRLRNLTQDAQEVQPRLAVTPYNFAGETLTRQFQPIQLGANESRDTRLELELPQPRLWFPKSHGEPWLYAAAASLGVEGNELGQTVQQVFGVRQIEVEAGPERWEWRLNGRRIFPKGSNYVSDFYLDGVTPEGLQRDIALAREANLDVLRVHAHIAPAEFYRLCDEAGLMVMSDFPMIWTYAHGLPACAAVEFRASVLRQAEDMVALLGSRPSIVSWSMHNEPPWTPTASFLGKELHEARVNQSVDEEAAALVRSLDPTRPAMPASGLYDQHLYHGWYTGTWQENRDLRPAFPSEFGVQALPNLDSPFWATVETNWPVNPDDPSWAHAGYQSVFWASPGAGLPSQFESLADYIAESQAYQAFFIRYTIDGWRLNKFAPVGGYVHFLFADCWPAITWSVLDFHRLPKAGYQALAEASRPVRLCLDLAEGFTVEQGFKLVFAKGSQLAIDLHLVNDDYRLEGTATIEWWLEPKRSRRLAAAISRRLARLTVGRLRVRLPSADQPALLAHTLRLPLHKDGTYTLRTRVKLGGRIVDENQLEFRVGHPQAAARPPRRVPDFLVSRVYQLGSLRHSTDGFTFRIHNPAIPITLQRLVELRVDGNRIESTNIDLVYGGVVRQASTVTSHAPLELPSGEGLGIAVHGHRLEPGRHSLEISVQLMGIGEISARVTDRLG